MRNTNIYEQVSDSDINDESPETFRHIQTSGRIIASMPDLDENFPGIPLPPSIANAVPSAKPKVLQSKQINILSNELTTSELPTELPVAQPLSNVRLNSSSSFGQIDSVASQKFSRVFKFNLANISHNVRSAGVIGLLFVIGLTALLFNSKSNSKNEPVDNSTVYKPVEQTPDESASVVSNQTVNNEQNGNNRHQSVNNEFTNEQFTDYATASTPDRANVASTDSNSVWNREPSSEYSPWDYSSTTNQNVNSNVNHNLTHTANADERPILTPAAPLVVPQVANNNVNNNVGNNGNNLASEIGFSDFAPNELLPYNASVQSETNNVNNANQPRQETVLPNYSYYAANGQPNVTNAATAMPNNGQYNNGQPNVQSPQQPPTNQYPNHVINQVTNVVPNNYQNPRMNAAVPVAEGVSTLTPNGYPNSQSIQTTPSVQVHSMQNPNVAYQNGYNTPRYPQPYYPQPQPVQQNNYQPQYQAYQQQYANQYNQQQYQQAYQQQYPQQDPLRLAQVPPIQTSPPQVYVNPQYNVPAYNNVPEGRAVPPPTSRDFY